MKRTLAWIALLAVALPHGVSFRDIASPPGDNWLSYSGDYSGRRFSALAQVGGQNVSHLTTQWVFHIPGSTRLEATPIVTNGVMYVSNSNEVYALDASTGRTVWHYHRAASKATGGNRGVAVLGNRVFVVSSDAHLIALQAKTGGVLWDVQYADPAANYSATLAPLAIKGKVVVGVSGGDCGVRGFVDAYDADTGRRVWRFWTVPAPGGTGAEEWGGHPAGGATWMTGTYDPDEDVIYWTTGNPGPGFYGHDRPGDNLYSDCLLALDATTGTLKWHFQFTPHDTHDWDAAEIPVLIDATFQGRPRKLVAQADRNGFFYVLDRADGKMLLGKPFVKKLTWARGILSSGRPDVLPDTDPTPEGRRVCPANVGATNWFSPSYDPETRLFYVMAIEDCDVYYSSAFFAKPGECNNGTGVDRLVTSTGQFYLRAIDLDSGDVRWEVPLTSGEDGYNSSMPGTLTTAGGIIFFGDDAGYFSAADARTGKLLWGFSTGQMITASPMTYAVAGRQYVALASGTDVFAFALFKPAGPRQPSLQEDGVEDETFQ